jgi:DNA-binding NarL/FixJ family response regulator
MVKLRLMIVVVPDLQPQDLEIATRRPANGYLIQRELTASSLRAAVLQVAAGQLFIPSAVAAYLLDRARGHQPAMLPRLQQLSPRESEVLSLLVLGAGNKEIASRLGLSIHGVKRHVSMLLSQFHSPSRVHLVANVLRSGLLPVGGSD